MMIAIHKESGTVLCSQIKLAETIVDRTIGFMFQQEVKDKGILFIPSNSIHTCFMRFSIDVLFINNHGKIIKIFRKLKPWRMTRMYFKASQVLELPPNSIPINISEGDHLEFKDV